MNFIRLIFLVLLLSPISLQAQLPPILRQYFTTNAHVLSNGAGALTNNGTGTLGWLSLSSFAPTNVVIYDPATFNVSPTNLNDFAASNITAFRITQTNFFSGSPKLIINAGGISALQQTDPLDSSSSYIFPIEGSYGGAVIARGTNCVIAPEEGSHLAAFIEDCSDVTMAGLGGSFGGLEINLATNVDFLSSISMAFSLMERVTNTTWRSTDGSFTGGTLFKVADSSFEGAQGSFSGNYVNLSSGIIDLTRFASVSAINAFRATNSTISVETGSAAFGTLSGSNSTIYSRNNSLVIGAAGAQGVNNEQLYADSNAAAFGRDVASAGNNWTFGIHGTNSTPFSLALVNNGVQFQVVSNGNIPVIRGVTGYSWPTVHATGALTNNGSGTLGYYDLTLLAPATGGTYIATNSGTGWDTTVYSATNDSKSVSSVSLTVKSIVGQTNNSIRATGTNGAVDFVVKPDTHRVGIGTDSPAQALDVVGQITASSLVNGLGFFAYPSCGIGNAGILMFPGVALSSDSRVNWSAANGLSAADTSLWRVSAGVVGSTNILIEKNLTVGGGVNFSRFATNANVSMLTNYYVWAVTSVAVLVTNTLPSASTSQGIHFIIKDEGGNASSTNITIAVQSGDRIDGALTATINANYGAKNVYSAGSTNWFIY